MEGSDYKTIKKDCDDKILRLEVELQSMADKGTSERGAAQLIKQVLNGLINLDHNYLLSDTEAKRILIGSMFPEKWCFDGKEHRTAQANEVMTLLC